MIRNRPVWLFYIIYEIIIKNFEAKVKTKSVAMVKKNYDANKKQKFRC